MAAAVVSPAREPPAVTFSENPYLRGASVRDVVDGMRLKAERELVQRRGAAVLAERAAAAPEQAIVAVQHGAVGLVTAAARASPCSDALASSLAALVLAALAAVARTGSGAEVQEALAGLLSGEAAAAVRSASARHSTAAELRAQLVEARTEALLRERAAEHAAAATALRELQAFLQTTS